LSVATGSTEFFYVLHAFDVKRYAREYNKSEISICTRGVGLYIWLEINVSVILDLNCFDEITKIDDVLFI